MDVDRESSLSADIKAQECRYAKAKGRGLPDDNLDFLEVCRMISGDMVPRKLFTDRPHEMYWYERLQIVGISDSKVVGDLANTWAAVSN